MAGLTLEGFTPLTHDEIITRIQSRLEQYNPGFDFSPESPDGQLVSIFSYEISQAWNQLDLVYRSYDPDQTTGAGLRNMGLITGIPYGAASRSVVTLELDGEDGTLIPSGTVFVDEDNNEFATQLPTNLPATMQAVCVTSGPIPVPAGSVTKIKQPITGLASIQQPTNGNEGKPTESETAFRNRRNKTVLRNFNDTITVISSRLFELGIGQVEVVNNDSSTHPLPDGTPPNTVHVTIGEVGPGISDEDIAKVILATKSLGCPTYGTTTVSVNDSHGHPHDISFSKATAVNIYMDIEVDAGTADVGGAQEGITADLVEAINSLLAGEDVVWSRLFGIITPYAEADVTKLELSTDGINYAPSNITINADQFADTTTANISLVINLPK